MNKIKVLFWGTLFDPDKAEQLLKDSKVGLQNAANTYQWGFIDGLVNNDIKNIDVATVIPVGSFPKSNSKLFFKENYFRRQNISVTELGFINFYFIREQTRSRKLFYWTRRNIRNEERVILFVYSLYLPFLTTLKKLKKNFNQKLHVCLIVPDLPGEYGVLRKIWTPAGIWDRFIVKKTLNLSKLADSYVLLTELMKDPLNIYKPYCVVEGFFSKPENGLKFPETNRSAEKIILYTGSFNQKFGINNLLKSFSEIEDQNYRLWLCGPPNDAAEVIAAAKKDKRIEYFGFITKQEIIELQNKCTILINPRENKGNFVKYSFPSKTLEYLASGKPVIMYKLDGLPSEYDRYINYINCSLTDKVIEVASRSSETLEKMGKEAIEWLINEKNGQIQIKKVLKMLQGSKCHIQI